jgi:hypothetical protein
MERHLEQGVPRPSEQREKAANETLRSLEKLKRKVRAASVP